ncbi:peptidyl-prolyl cis-trans isomerase-like 2 [Histomonas meleagridis]|uniref:peptidyl-prolyl cis-trans isomerase-like 2 n=1 Tax=Histomonas meleagridis TaxID=135588 RepID=UPI00355A2BA1|nr:peptidyl-prolyl cis-trans isomerase-like 2 [Histomonas meleagridis]KAH0802671.1 peptidyl-prolyl cis-trans isomerase-like 2 [Histomonas meleagridis]
MGKRKRKVDGVRYSHVDITAGQESDKGAKVYDPTSFDFDIDCLTYLPLRNPYICKHGYSFSKESAAVWCSEHQNHPFVEDAPFSVEELVPIKFTLNAEGQKIDPITENILTPKRTIVVNRKTSNVYDYQTIIDFNIKPYMMVDLLTGEEFDQSCITVIHDPNRSRNLPPNPLISTQVTRHESDIVRNANNFVNALNLKQEDVFKEDDTSTWFLAQPNQKSLHEATIFKQMHIKTRPYAVMDTTIGEITIELDVDFAGLGCINFIGCVLKGLFTNVKVTRVRREQFFEVSINTDIDETVWRSPIAYERDDARRGFQYPVYIINKENQQIHITKSSQFAISCVPLQIDEYHIIGGVVNGGGIVSSICNGKVFPDGRPVHNIDIRGITIMNNPFPLQPPGNK